MLIGHADHISESRSLKDQILAYSGSELSDDEQEGCLEQILYSASFEEHARNCVKYDTVIWLAISLLLVLAWGIGLLMLLYLPIRRYVLQKDLSSRRLYVTRTEVVYKVSRPSYIPFWGTARIDRRVPLSLMIITEASKITQDVSTSGNHAGPSTDVENIALMPRATEGSVVLRSPSKSLKMAGSPHTSSLERRVTGGLLLNKLEEVNKSVKRLELLIEKSHASSSIS
ncbi:hypothetical protein HKD37_18G051834 [Glycine soja]